MLKRAVDVGSESLKFVLVLLCLVVGSVSLWVVGFPIPSHVASMLLLLIMSTAQLNIYTL